MAYYLDLFTPETWAAFRAHGAKISGFREHQRQSAERIQPGDQFLCYVVRLSRWCGLLQVRSKLFTDSSPVFSDPDPFVLRYEVESVVALDLEKAIPILDDAIWSKLSTTRELEKGAPGWAQFANLRASLRLMSDDDGNFLDKFLRQQDLEQRTYPFSPQDLQRLGQKASIRTADRAVLVEVPTAKDETEAGEPTEGIRESHRVQATVARIGLEMGFKVWVPKSDKQVILNEIPSGLHSEVLDLLPLNYDDTTLRTIEQIDVIWLKGRSMARAFEIEHTTAIYSGLLRMADLLALQPNMDIRLHIVAPNDKREKVLREISRPVFSLLDRGPLYESCSYLTYEAVAEIATMKHLDHMNESIIEEFEEFAQDE